MTKKIFFVFSLFTSQLLGQYAPVVGKDGTTAIYKDSTVFVDWASSCEINLGLLDISELNSGNPRTGSDSSALKKAGENGVVSLGDGGWAILQFNSPIRNGEGWDFAVFENAFINTFLELAFVEVSSDGINYFRFPASSLTPNDYQVGPYGSVEAEKINNLAGKYTANYGTPFDLDELKNEIGLDVNSITHLKIVDVVGTMNDSYASLDKDGIKINDPYPTPFESGGFDLDAVGVIHNNSNSINELDLSSEIQVYPNPSKDVVCLNFKSKEIVINTLQIIDLSGKVQKYIDVNRLEISKITVSDLSNGIYFLTANTNKGKFVKKISVQRD